MQHSQSLSTFQTKARPPAPSYPVSRSRSQIRAQAGDSWLIAGTRGSGKTTFAKQLAGQLLTLFPKSRLYVFDSKFEGDFDGWPGTVQTSQSAPPRPSGNARIQVWQPIHLVPDEIEIWLEHILHDAPAIVFIDELEHLCYKKTVTSKKYKELLKIGRALPVGAITCTQELTEIPRQAIGQTTHVARFRLLQPYERSLMNHLMSATEPLSEPTHEHGFYYSGTRDRSAPEYFENSRFFF